MNKIYEMVNLFDFMVSWACKTYLEKEMCMFVIFCSAFKTERLFSLVLFQITFVCKATHHVTSLALWWQTVKNSLFSTFKVALRILKVLPCLCPVGPLQKLLGVFQEAAVQGHSCLFDIFDLAWNGTWIYYKYENKAFL